MIKSFRHKGLWELFFNGKTAKIQRNLMKRCLRRLDVLDVADKTDELKIPGFNFHKLEGKPVRFSIHVNGPVCITFEWHDGDAYRVDLENYH